MNLRSPESQPQETRDRNVIIRGVIRDAVIQHHREHPGRLSFLLAYGSKQLTGVIDKEGGKAGAILETTDVRQRRESETTILYHALLAMFQGVANKLLQPVEYTLVTENPRLIQWAQTTGDAIFHWTAKASLDEMRSFTCMVKPRLSSDKLQKWKETVTARRLIWEERDRLTTS